ncbi:unnamed protein product [Meloidogyne enterolobii]|uniref:Uncharacterized protein n=1 Tax=Meloidogyne enterolobii TaxID=390850 RepID=A0ACB0Y4Y5_MELEN
MSLSPREVLGYILQLSHKPPNYPPHSPAYPSFFKFNFLLLIRSSSVRVSTNSLSFSIKRCFSNKQFWQLKEDENWGCWGGKLKCCCCC